MLFEGTITRRWSLRGAAIGVVLAGLIAGQYWTAVHAGMRPAAAGYGASILGWLASAPIGLILLYVIILPAMVVTGLSGHSPTLNIAVILLFGVVGNWVGIGMAIDLIVGGNSKRAGLAVGEKELERTAHRR